MDRQPTMTPSKCRHGLDQGSCEICRVLDAEPAPPSPARRSGLRGGRRGYGLRLGVGAVVAVVVIVVVLQVVAAVWAVVQLLQLVAVALIAGWIGWRLGLVQGRRRRS